MAETRTITRACAACANWNELGQDKGECRAHAPQTVIFQVDADTKFESRFPLTAAADWCGDFMPR